MGGVSLCKDLLWLVYQQLNVFDQPLINNMSTGDHPYVNH